MRDNLLMTYNPRVLVGHWEAQRTQEDAFKRKFISDFQEGKCYIQRTRLMRSNLLTPVILPILDGAVEIGSMVQIVAPDMPVSGRSQLPLHHGLTLASTVPLSKLNENSQLCPGCPLLGSPDINVTVRNTWRILGEDGKSKKPPETLKFGQKVTIASYTQGEPLFIRSLPISVTTFKTSEFKGASLHLSPILDRYCLFRILHAVCDDMEGRAVEPSMRICINHVATNENLCVEKANLDTFFGVEKAVSLITFNRKRNVKENIWMFATRRGLKSHEQVTESC